MTDGTPIDRLATALSERFKEGCGGGAGPKDGSDDAPGDRRENAEGSEAVRAYTESDGRRAIYLERSGEDGRRRAIPVEDAVEAALWRETDLDRSEVPDVGEELDRDRLVALARGDESWVSLRVAGHRVIVSADGSVDVANPLRHRARRLGRKTAAQVRSSQKSIRRHREALDAWLDEDVGPDPETVTAIETRIRDRVKETGGATTVIVGDGPGPLRCRLGEVAPALRRTWELTRSDDGGEPSEADGNSSGAADEDFDRREGSDAVSTREGADGTPQVVVERLDKRGGVRDVPVGDAIEAALWRETELDRSDIPDVSTAVDEEQLLALARGDRETVTAHVAGHAVRLARDGTIDVAVGPLTRCRRLLENARAVGDVDLARDAVNDGADRDSRNVFTRRETAGGEPAVLVERLDRDGGTREVPVEDAIEAALWRESDLERSAIPDVSEEVDREQLLALASGDLEAVTVRLAGHMLLVHDDGRITVRRQAEADRRSVLKVASVAGVASTWGLAATGATEETSEGEDVGDGSDAAESESTTTVRHGYGGATTTVTTVTPDGTEVVETVEHAPTPTETATPTASETATETATPTATETASETTAGGGGGGSGQVSGGAPSTSGGSGGSATETATETASTTETEAATGAGTTTTASDETASGSPASTDDGDTDDDDYGEQRYGRMGYGGVPVAE